MINIKPFRLLLGFGLLALPVVSATTASAATLTSQVNVQPIDVCDNTGANCAPENTFTPITEKIYAQAGVNINFLPLKQFNSTSFQSINSDTQFNSLLDNPGHGQSANPNTLNMFFVNALFPDPNDQTFGYARVSANGLAIASDTFSFNGAMGRLDTIAHEIGHNLGLDHLTFGAGGANNLMSSGTIRNVPSAISDIFPDGAQLDQLTAQQINVIRNSQFAQPLQVTPIGAGVAVPEPSPSFLTWLALGSVALLQSKFKSKKALRKD